jgi:hypothetical protein
MSKAVGETPQARPRLILVLWAAISLVAASSVWGLDIGPVQLGMTPRLLRRSAAADPRSATSRRSGPLPGAARGPTRALRSGSGRSRGWTPGAEEAGM